MKITGASASGLGTCLVDHEHKVVLDIGYCSTDASKYQNVLVTHAHVDHLAGAVSHAATRSLRKVAPSRFICSPEVGRSLKKLLDLWVETQGGFEFETIPLNPGERLSLTPTLFVTPFPTFHRLPSQGYLLYETRKKLKPGYVGMPGNELATLRKEGVELEDVTEIPVLAYTGDTTPEALGNPEVQRAKVLVTECTFLGDTFTVVEARKRGHTHLDELRQYVQGRDCGDLYLCHFSDRYTKTEIVKMVNEGMQATLLLESEGPVNWE